MRITITSTAHDAALYAPRCLASTATQKLAGFGHRLTYRHIYLAADASTFEAADGFLNSTGISEELAQVRDVSEQDEGVLGNLVPVWRSLPDDEIIVWLDGDDWFANEYVLNVIASHYAQSDTWLTYGSFMYPDGYPGCAHAIDGSPRENNNQYGLIHLKTFYAGLLKQIKEEDLRGADGKWSKYCSDIRVMLPMFEMASIVHATYIPHMLYVYNNDHAFYINASDKERAREQDESNRILALPRYEPVKHFSRTP